MIGRWFEQSAVPQDYRGADYAVLLILLAVGVVVRFWGLDNVGLHGDEETMAMPTMSLLETGQPLLLSGMYYSRALLQIYLMSGSVLMFGESEWAFRFPSAIVGSFTGLAAFFMGRRFLPPQFNLAFVATVTLLPGMIAISQTARMYVFFVTLIIWFAACIFRWERDQKITSLICALLVWSLAVHFHILSIFAAPLFLFPGISRQSWLHLYQGAAAFAIGWAVFIFQRDWVSSKYPEDEQRPPEVDENGTLSSLDTLLAGSDWILFVTVAVIAGLSILAFINVSRRSGRQHALPIVPIGLGLVAIMALHYHVAAILMILGIVFWLREPKLDRSWLLMALGIAVVIAIIQMVTLYVSGVYPGRKLIGAVVGVPSVWPVIRFLEFAPFAGIVYGAALLLMFRQFTIGRKLPMHFIFFAIAVWAPLLLLGLFRWYLPPRYALGQLGFFLMCTFAGLVFLAHHRNWLTINQRLSRPLFAGLAIITLALINPIALPGAVNPTYENYPDHKGAAEFIRELNLDEGATIIAEDALQQGYYLGRVDYWLREIGDARSYSVVREGKILDQYTGAVVLGTGEELEALLDERAGTEVYIIGSGENFVGNVRRLRGEGIAEALQSDRLEIVFNGRDNKTKIWKALR